MARVALAVMLAAACSDPASVPDAGIDAPDDAHVGDELVISPVSFDFGAFDVGSGDPPTHYTFEITNRGASTASLTTIEIAGPATTDFVIAANDCGALLDPGVTCNVRVEFVATTSGARDATLQVTGSTSASAVLSGTGIAPISRVRFYPSARNLGDVATGMTGAPFTFTVKNESVAATTLVPSLVGANAQAFRIASTDCTSGALPVGGMCSLTVELVPPFGGQFSADVWLTQPDGAIAKAGLTGVSTTPLDLAPYSFLFSPFLIGQAAPGNQATFTLTNTGTTTTGPITATTIGAAAAEFTIRSTTCTTLAPLETCSVVVEMTPATRGNKIAQLSVGDTVTAARTGLRGSAYSVLITGTATFPDTVVGQQSAIQSFAVSNASPLATGALAVALGGTNASQFSIVGTTCTTGIPANSGCTIMLRFAPTSAGPKTATLDVSGTPGGSDSVVITGRAL